MARQNFDPKIVDGYAAVARKTDARSQTKAHTGKQHELPLRKTISQSPTQRRVMK